MTFLVFVLLIAVIWLGSHVSALRDRLQRLEELHAMAKEHLNSLTARLSRLEEVRATAAPVATSIAMPIVAPPVAKPVDTPIEKPPDTPVDRPATTTPAPRPSDQPARATPKPSPLVTPPPTRAVESQRTAPAPAAASAVSAAATPMRSGASAAQSAAETAESWELVVGTSWLNKIGVLVFVVGLALLVGYSFRHIGPAGRVAIGYLVSGALLGGGVWLERRQAFRNYAYGLVAGGWAGLYFTTFAMHDVPAARIIENDALAVTLLTAVAAGMIAHSLRYRSQVVTSLAFIVAYTTLALSPLSGFSLAASVPLAVAVLLVSQRLGWSGVSALGIAASYGTFVLRGQMFPGGVMDPATTLPYAVLAVYWLTFEAADIAGLRLRGRADDVPAAAPQSSMMALNAIGFLGAMIMTIPPDDPPLFSTFLFSAAAAYVTSALARAWLVPQSTFGRTDSVAFDSAHGATAIAALLFAVAIGLRFHGNQASLARLLEAQLLITAGFTLRDVWLRRIGSVGFGLASAQAFLVAANSGPGAPVFGWSWMFGPAALVLVFVAAAGYGNREALRRRSATAEWLEPAFTWIATALIVAACVLELTPAHQGLAGLLLALVLLEAGLRRGADYVFQSYSVGALASYAVLAAFVMPVTIDGRLRTWGEAPTDLDAWIVLPLAVASCAFAAWRLASRPATAGVPQQKAAAAASGAVATLLLLVFEWRVLSPNAIAPAWSATAVVLVALGLWRAQVVLRWQGYLVALIALLRAVSPLAAGSPETTAAVVSIGLVIALAYTAAYLGRRALPVEALKPDAVAPEAAAVVALSLAATASLAAYKWRVLPELLVAPTWAATGVLFVVLGFRRERPGQRGQGYALAALGATRSLLLLGAEPVATAAAAGWAVTTAAAVYVASWLARRPAAVRDDSLLIGPALAVGGSAVMALLATRILEDVAVGPAWAAMAAVLLGVGLWRRSADLRWHAQVLLALGAVWMGEQLFLVGASSAMGWSLVVITLLYGCGLAVRRFADTSNSPGAPDATERIVSAAVLAGATLFLALLIVHEVRTSLVTLTLGIQGLVLMFVGLVVRERVLRLSGLALLLVCILKLFVYDLRELEALARIMSFVALGLFLLAISWTYTRYREQIRRFL